MKHLKYKFLLCILLCGLLQSCTGAGGAGSLVDAIKDIVSPTPDTPPSEPTLPGAPSMAPSDSVQEAETKIAEIQTTLNQDATYAITSQDISDLKTEGLLTDENEIKAWVK